MVLTALQNLKLKRGTSFIHSEEDVNRLTFRIVFQITVC